MKTRALSVVLASLALQLLSSCSSTTENSGSATQRSVTLLAYDAFTPQEGIFESFTAETGIEVKVVTGGDTGTLVSRAILTAGNPEADVLWGSTTPFLLACRKLTYLIHMSPSTPETCASISMMHISTMPVSQDQ